MEKKQQSEGENETKLRYHAVKTMDRRNDYFHKNLGQTDSNVSGDNFIGYLLDFYWNKKWWSERSGWRCSKKCKNDFRRQLVPRNYQEQQKQRNLMMRMKSEKKQ